MTERAKRFLAELAVTRKTYVHIEVQILREALEEARCLAVEQCIAVFDAERARASADTTSAEILDRVQERIK